jgi:hypothetical protein
MNNKILRRAVILSVLLSSAPQLRALDLNEAYDTLHASAADFSAQAKTRADERETKDKAPAAEDETCDVCWNSDFKPLNEKARAVKAWEEKRLDLAVAIPIAGFALLGALLSPGSASANEGLEAYTRIKGEEEALRAKAVSLQGLEIKDGFVRLRIVKGVDYVLEPAAAKK